MHTSGLRRARRSEESAPSSLDPVKTNPQYYRVVFENDRVRVLKYTDRPGDHATPHAHPDSVMIALSSYRRRLQAGGRRRDVELTEGTAYWLPAQRHAGENIGDTPTHAVFVELKEAPSPPGSSYLGPA